MSLAVIIKQIAQIPAQCSVCGKHGGFVALPPFRTIADRRCRNHLWADWRGRDTPGVHEIPASESSGVFVPPNALDEARPGAPTAAPSAPVKAGPGDSFDLFGGA